MSKKNTKRFYKTFVEKGSKSSKNSNKSTSQPKKKLRKSSKNAQKRIFSAVRLFSSLGAAWKLDSIAKEGNSVDFFKVFYIIENLKIKNKHNYMQLVYVNNLVCCFSYKVSKKKKKKAILGKKTDVITYVLYLVQILLPLNTSR